MVKIAKEKPYGCDEQELKIRKDLLSRIPDLQKDLRHILLIYCREKNLAMAYTEASMTVNVQDLMWWLVDKQRELTNKEQ